jgi:DNA-binding transcriptional MocR family regulator
MRARSGWCSAIFIRFPSRSSASPGGQHGLLCAMMALLRAGDTVVTEQMTYPGLITAARMLGIRLIGLEMDDEGVLPSALDEVCRNHRISALYCTPTIQNPTTAVLSVARREALVRCAGT